MKKRDKFFIFCVMVSFIFGFLISKFIFKLPNMESFFSANLTSLFIGMFLFISFLKEDWKKL